MSKYYFIGVCSEELNNKLQELKLHNCSGLNDDYTTTTVHIAEVEDSFESNFFNGYGKPTYKNRNNSSAVQEFKSEEDFINALK